MEESFTSDDIRKVVFSMGCDKSPRINGLNPRFFQKHWDVIGANISSFCISYATSGMFSKSLNETVLLLIPKETKLEFLLYLLIY